MKTFKTVLTTVLFSLVVSGCGASNPEVPDNPDQKRLTYIEGPLTLPEMSDINVQVQFYENHWDLNNAWWEYNVEIEGRFPEISVWGWSNQLNIGSSPACIIHVVKGDWITIIHELQHCFHPDWRHVNDQEE